MAKNGSAEVAQKKPVERQRKARIKTRYAGVYTREIINRQGKPDIAFDLCWREGGRKIWRTLGYASEGVNAAFANAKRGEIIAKAAGHEYPQKTKRAITLGEAWGIFWERTKDRVSETYSYENRYKNHIKPMAHRRLDQISTIDMEDLKNAMLRKGLAPASVIKVLGEIRLIYRKMIVWGFYKGLVPTDGIVWPRADNKRTRFLSREEALILLDALKKRSPTWHDVAWLSLHTGMRLGEVLNLRGQHLDFKGSGQILIFDAKTGSRAVAMTPQVREFLLERQPSRPDGFVFCSRRREKTSFNASRNTNLFREIVNSCGLNDGVTDRRQKVVFHTLRHTFCSWLAQAGVPLFTIGQIVGHSNTNMTQRYSHLCPDAGQQAAAKISAIIGDRDSHT